MDMHLELVVLPVNDVERAKEFYERAGFRLDVDHRDDGDCHREARHADRAAPDR